MDKIKLILQTNFKIHKRIRSEQNPIVNYWFNSLDIKLPPEILAYVLIICLFTCISIGAIAEGKSINVNNILNPFYCSVILFVLLFLLEIFIIKARLIINTRLLQYLPFTPKEKITIILCNHFLSLRTICFLCLVVSYIVFSFTYNYSIKPESLLFLTDFFVIFSAISFLFTKQNFENKKTIDTKLFRAFRLCIVICIILLVKKGVSKNILSNIDSAQNFLFQNILTLTICAILIFPIMVFVFIRFNHD